MFRSKTLFIIGAGASCEVGLPAGKELTKIISSKLKSNFDGHRGFSEPKDHEIAEAFRWKIQIPPSPSDALYFPRGELQKYCEAADQISKAMPLEPSIDQFIDNHRGNGYIELGGKLAIVKSILEEERKSKIFIDYNKANYSINFDSTDKTWLNKFIELLCTGCHLDDLHNLFSNVSLLIFNYDRCVEHFLYYGLQVKYGMDDKKTADLLRGLNVIHPYGKVGKLSWEDPGSAIRFGEQPTSNGLLTLADQIKTFTESIDDRKLVDRMRSLADEANNIVFLGFGFHAPNLDLVAPESKKRSKQIYSSSKGLSSSFCQTTRQKLLDRFSGGHGLMEFGNNMTCFELFEEHGRIFAE
jgi:hypothetical protein